MLKAVGVGPAWERVQRYKIAFLAGASHISKKEITSLKKEVISIKKEVISLKNVK